MQRIFYPDSLVVIGVSERPDNLARCILANLQAFGYKGKVYAVGRSKGTALGIPIEPSLDLVPDGLDLAVILTPAATVPDIMEVCGRKGIHRAVIESGGFSEFSPEGRELERRLIEVAGKWDMRFVGPNCISVVNLETGLCLPFASMSPVTARLGPASVISQSGGVSVTYTEMLCRSGVGVDKAISIGNKTDLDECDYLNYLQKDPSTKIICMYLESVDNGRELVKLAHSSEKPIIIHKTNRGQASQHVAHSHTAALANDDQIVTAAFRQAGIFRSENFRDTIAIAQGLSLPKVKGNNLVIISRSGGHAVIAADAAERFGFQLPPLPDEFVKRVRSLFRADVIALTNPLDLGVIFDFNIYAQIVEQCLKTLSPDAILLINAYSLNESKGAYSLAKRVDEIVKESKRPIAFCVYAQGDEREATQKLTSMPIFAEIEDAMRGLAASRDWARRRTQPNETATAPPAPSSEAQQYLTKPGVLTSDRALDLIKAYGIQISPFEVASNPERAAQASARLGYPVALKALAPQLIHKSDMGGVKLGLENETAVRSEAAAMQARITPPVSFMVQRMASEGLEVILGGKRDRSFGPVIMFGLGGIYVEVFKDVAFRVAPLSRAEAEDMIEEVRGSRLLDGVRGKPRMDKEALIKALLSTSRLLVENTSITELDINPLMVLERSAVALDARAVIGEEKGISASYAKG